MSEAELIAAVNQTIAGRSLTVVPDTVPVPHAVEPKRPRRYLYGGGTLVKTDAAHRKITKAVKRLDADLREAIEESSGQPPTIGQLFTLQSLLRAEQYILLCEKWCRDNPADAGGIIKMAAEIAKASVERDKHFDRLGLGGESQASIVELLYKRIG